MDLLPEIEMAGPDIFSAKETGGSRAAYLAVPITLNTIAAIFVIIRLSSNFETARKLLFDDYIAAAAVVLSASTFGFSDYGLRRYSAMENSDPETSTIIWTNMYEQSVALFVLSAVSTIASKTPILFLYIRLFGSERWLRWCSYATLLVITVPLLAGVITVSVVCSLHGDAPSNCLEWWDRAWVGCGSLSLVVDVAILLFPIPIISKLRLPVRKRLGLALVFASGIFAIGTTGVAFYYKIRSLLRGTSSNWTVGMYYSAVEWCISIMVGFAVDQHTHPEVHSCSHGCTHGCTHEILPIDIDDEDYIDFDESEDDEDLDVYDLSDVEPEDPDLDSDLEPEAASDSEPEPQVVQHRDRSKSL
ncbi:hypothetical protein F4818DRAFT_452386 [Hypoxylon cercidicola]|nr:hypothetical protein F4818DRAFT_452386 [Hypoxylon cercidicola]